MTLRQNVLLLRDPDDPAASFYPRFNLMSSISARALEPHHRAALKHLHDEHFYRWGREGGVAVRAHVHGDYPGCI